MKIVVPPNIFSAIFLLSLPKEIKENAYVMPASMIAGEIKEGKADLGLMPSIEIISSRELFVSGQAAVAFDSVLSNAYLYFKEGSESLDELWLRGDVSINEIMLSTILFRETYSKDIQIKLDSSSLSLGEHTYLIAGNECLENHMFSRGMSFSDEISQYIDFPYLNFLLASRDETCLKELNPHLKDIDRKIEDKLSDTLDIIKPDAALREFLEGNYNSVYYEMTKNEKDGLMELVKLPFYHGITEDVPEIKFVD